MNPEKLKQAIELFDQTNSQDPNQEIWDGKEYPKELLYSKRLEDWIRKLEPNPSETLLLASHSQHLCRWMIPRSTFEDGKVGYLQWRKKLYQFHADQSAEILKKVGYSDEIIQKVQSIHLKKNLKTDREVQIMKDALCLVFLEFQFEEFMQKTAKEKMPQIIQKTWGKMSEKGKEFALKISFSTEAFRLIKESLSL